MGHTRNEWADVGMCMSVNLFFWPTTLLLITISKVWATSSIRINHSFNSKSFNIKASSHSVFAVHCFSIVYLCKHSLDGRFAHEGQPPFCVIPLNVSV